MKKIAIVFVMCLFAQLISAQTRQITGTVTDAKDGSTLPGVSVKVKGTDQGAVTDMDGKYSVKVPQGSKALIFSFIGYADQEIVIGASNVVNATMKEDAVGLSEVVVTAMGIKKDKKALGYAVSEVKSEDLQDVQMVDAATALQGKIAGVSISPSSGAPGASTRVIVRGVSSLTGSNQPLYVIDGVPVNNEIAGNTGTTNSVDFGNAASDINPNDIETISILKGAAATNLYGSRAANGVIVINTKSGKKGKDLKVNFASSFSLMEVGRLPYYQDVFGQGWSGHYASEENGSWGPVMDGKDRLTGNIVDNSQRIAPFKFYENSLRDFYEIGYTRDNSVSLSGGTANVGYFVSLTNTKADGVIPGAVDVLDRNAITFKANGGNKKTKINFSINYVNKKLKAVGAGQGDDAGSGKAVFQEILQNPVSHYVPEYRNYMGKFDNLDNYYTQYAQNPYFIINENGNNFKQNRLISSLNINHEIMKGLNISWRGGLDHYSYFFKQYGAIAKINDGTPNASSNDVAGMTREDSRTVTQLNSDLVLTYDNKVELAGGNLEYTAMLGNNVNERTSKRDRIISKGLVVPNYYNVANISGSAEVSTYEYKRRLVGLFGQIDLNYNNFLFLQLTARNDWSSTLPSDENSFFYPGVNLGLIFTDLLPKNDILSYGKIRTSYAMAGNDADPYQLEATYAAAIIRSGGFGVTNYPVGGVAAYEKGLRLGNKALKPELSKEFEIGVDLRFFQNRLGIDLAYYNKVTTDLIMEADIAASSGYLRQTTNLGQITNDGIELKIDATPIKLGDFQWDLSFVYTKSNTVLDELSEELGVSEYVINSAYETEFVAIPGKQLGQFRIPDFKRTDDGKIIVGDDGLPLEGDKILYKSSVPDYNLSVTNAFTYKGFKLSALMDYQHGGYMYSYTSSITYWSGNNEQSITNMRRPYVIPNSVTADGNGGYKENTTPVHDNWHEYYSSNNNKPIESERIIEKTYFRLRELSLSYKVDQNFVKKIGLSSANISLYGRNLVLWTPADNSFVDPETTTYGNDLEGLFGEFGGAPSVRTYGLKINLEF